MADILLCLSDRIFKNSEFDLPLSRKELAELSGMSSETVIRMLQTNEMNDMTNSFTIKEINGSINISFSYDRELNLIFKKQPMHYSKTLNL